MILFFISPSSLNSLPIFSVLLEISICLNSCTTVTQLIMIKLLETQWEHKINIHNHLFELEISLQRNNAKEHCYRPFVTFITFETITIFLTISNPNKIPIEFDSEISGFTLIFAWNSKHYNAIRRIFSIMHFCRWTWFHFIEWIEMNNVAKK